MTIGEPQERSGEDQGHKDGGPSMFGPEAEEARIRQRIDNEAFGWPNAVVQGWKERTSDRGVDVPLDKIIGDPHSKEMVVSANPDEACLIARELKLSLYDQMMQRGMSAQNKQIYVERLNIFLESLAKEELNGGLFREAVFTLNETIGKSLRHSINWRERLREAGGLSKEAQDEIQAAINDLEPPVGSEEETRARKASPAGVAFVDPHILDLLGLEAQDQTKVDAYLKGKAKEYYAAVFDKNEPVSSISIDSLFPGMESISFQSTAQDIETIPDNVFGLVSRYGPDISPDKQEEAIRRTRVFLNEFGLEIIRNRKIEDSSHKAAVAALDLGHEGGIVENVEAFEQIKRSFPAETDKDNLTQIAEIVQKRLDQKDNPSET